MADRVKELEAISAKIHEGWMATKRSQGIASRKSESGEELMVPYAELSETAKDLDRGSVKAVLDAQAALALPAAPSQGDRGSEIVKDWFIEFSMEIGPAEESLIAQLEKLEQSVAGASATPAPSEEKFIVSGKPLSESERQWLAKSTEELNRQPTPAPSEAKHEHLPGNGYCCSCGWLCEGGHGSTCLAEWETHVAMANLAAQP